MATRARRAREAALVGGGAAAFALVLAALLPESAQPFHRAGFLLVLAGVIASAWRGGLVGGLVAGTLGAVGIATLFLLFGGPLGPPPIRLVVGGTIGGFGLALAVLIGQLRDRERRALEKEHAVAQDLMEANRSLREANESLQAFTFLVSHDLKAPVRAMEGLLGAFVEDHGKDPAIPAPARALVEDAREANLRLQRLLLALLDLSRAARIEPRDLEHVELLDLVASEACRTRYEDAVRERGSRITVEVPRGLVVFAEPAGMCQVLGNLIANAARHNPRDGCQVRVAASRSADGSTVDIAVEDDGPGFPPSVLAAFARGGLPSSTGGSGFGLAIARRAVERMGGAIALGRSEKLGGAAVWLKFAAASPSP